MLKEKWDSFDEGGCAEHKVLGTAHSAIKRLENSGIQDFAEGHLSLTQTSIQLCRKGDAELAGKEMWSPMYAIQQPDPKPARFEPRYLVKA